jgi:hypothetical protein
MRFNSGGADVVQSWCRSAGAEVLNTCRGSAEVIVQVQSRCKVLLQRCNGVMSK